MRSRLPDGDRLNFHSALVRKRGSLVDSASRSSAFGKEVPEQRIHLRQVGEINKGHVDVYDVIFRKTGGIERREHIRKRDGCFLSRGARPERSRAVHGQLAAHVAVVSSDDRLANWRWSRWQVWCGNDVAVRHDSRLPVPLDRVADVEEDLEVELFASIGKIE